MTTLAAESSSGHAAAESNRLTLERHGLPLRVGNRLMIIRHDQGSVWPKCIARTESGGRCLAELFAPLDFTYVQVTGYPGRICVWESKLPDECFLRQRCVSHVNSPHPDASEKEWNWFNPDVDADVFRSLAITWTDGSFDAPWDDCAWQEDDGCEADPHGAGGLIATADPPPPDSPASVVVSAAQTALYRWFDADDLLLYVGISDQLATRVGNHIKGSSWMDFAVRSTIERFPLRDLAAAAEEAAIKAEQPLFNHQHNDTPEARMRLVEYLVRHGRADLLAPAVSRG